MRARLRAVAPWLLIAALAMGCPEETVPEDDNTHHCLDEGANTCIGGDFMVCQDYAWALVEACGDYCDIELGCLLCQPGKPFCDDGVAMVCADDGMSHVEVMDCGEFETICDDGECVFDDPCVEAAAWQSNIGCEYWAADLDNSENFVDDAAAGIFAVAVANIGGEDTAHVVVEINEAPQGEPLELETVETADVEPGDLYIFELPRRDVDGVNMVNNIDDGPQSWLSSRAFRISSDLPIVAYQFNTLDQQYSNDASLLAPTPALGQDHRVVTYYPANPVDTPGSPMNRTYVAILGTEEETTVHVTPSYNVAYGPGDCDDGDVSKYPTAPEICDAEDNNCDGEIPDDEVDLDGDGWMDCAGDCDDENAAIYPGAPELCDGDDTDCDGLDEDEDDDIDGDGMTPCGGDCDDRYADVYPGAAEACDGLDNDCDGSIPADEDDLDGDGWMVCEGDCDDSDPLIHPLATELCDGIDNDCDGFDDAGVDQDGDGSELCDDCDDTDPTSYPGAPELCDGLDNDCDGALPGDEVDADGDGSPACEDCDEGNADVYPGAVELCDGLDNDCDGELLETADEDGDGFPPCTGVDEMLPGVAISEGYTRSWTIGPFDVLNLQTTFATLWPPSDIPDLTGTMITSDKPVSVFTGVDMSMAVFGNGEDSCCAEHIEQQVIPSRSMGTQFAVSRSAIRSWDNPEPDLYRVLAFSDGTTVHTNLPAPDDTFTLDAGHFQEFWTRTGFVVEADKPLHVAQILAVGSDAPNAEAGAAGDSAMLYVPAVDQRRPIYLFTTGVGFAVNYAVVSMPQGVTAKIDGADIEAPRCYGPLPDGVIDTVTYESWICDVAEGVHTVHSGPSPEYAEDPIAVFVYGYYQAGSYAYPAGADFRSINELSPN